MQNAAYPDQYRPSSVFPMHEIPGSAKCVVDGRHLAYQRRRPPPTEPASEVASLAFFHGVLRSADIFSPLTAPLGTRYDLWLLDHRGHGSSDRAERYLVVDFVADAVRWLRECVPRPVVLYGHSLGAMVAAGVAAQCPDLVRGCALEDPPFRTLGPHIGATNFLSYFAQIAELLKTPRSVPQLAAGLAEIRIVDPRGGPEIRLGDTRDPVSLRYQAAALKKIDPRVLEPLVGGQWMQGYDEPAIFAAIRCPVLLLQADASLGGMLVNEDVVEFRKHVEDVSLVRMPGVGHMMHWHKTQEIANLVFGFVESLS
jgi:pimeloyl-ACP methyl ester carboxylesterase